MRPNRERDHYVPLDAIAKLLEVLPSPQWRALVCLGRLCGLRIPSEAVGLTWADVNWAENVLAIRSTKTAREGHGYRICPLFPEVRHALEVLFAEAPEGSVYVFPEFRQRTQGPCGLRNANLGTQLTRYIPQAGLKPWPKLFSNLRRWAAIDLAAQFPAFCVSEWLGHTEAVSREFYLRVTPAMLAQAAQFARLPGAAQKAAQQITERNGTEQKAITPQEGK